MELILITKLVLGERLRYHRINHIEILIFKLQIIIIHFQNNLIQMMILMINRIDQ
jgi:hypothetical protein